MKTYVISMLSLCLLIHPSPLTSECLNQSLRNLVCISCHLSIAQRRTTYILHICISLCVFLLSLLGKRSVNFIPPSTDRQRLGTQVSAAKNACNNRSIVGRVSVCLCIPSLFPGNDSVKFFAQKQRIVASFVSYAVHVVSKESRRVVLPRNFCNICTIFFCVFS
jgi:hypothetical protein